MSRNVLQEMKCGNVPRFLDAVTGSGRSLCVLPDRRNGWKKWPVRFLGQAIIHGYLVAVIGGTGLLPVQ